MSVDTGASLHFNPGSALGFDIHLSDNEEEEDDEETKKRERELEEILTKTTAFDDLIEDDYETSMDASDMEDSRLHYLRSQTNEVTQNVQPKKTETSTPMHEVPDWNVDYTPIERPQNPALLPYHLEDVTGCTDVSLNYNDHEDARNLEKETKPGRFVKPATYPLPTVSAIPSAVPMPHRNDSDGLRDKLCYAGGGDGDDATTIADEPDRHDQNYDNWQEVLEQQREESQEMIASLKHELVLLKGEKERLSFSLQQARELLLTKNEEVQSAQMRADQLNEDMQKERAKNHQLSEKLQGCESLASSLQNQVSELSSYRVYTKRLETQENVMKNMQQAHAEELEKLHVQLDAKCKEQEVLQRRLNQLEKYQEQTLPTKMQGIDKLSLNLETVQKYCQQILSSEAFHDVDVIRSLQVEDDRLRNQQKQEIESLMATIVNLNQRLHDLATQDSVPLAAHRTALQQVENEKYKLEKSLELTLEEFSVVKKEKDFLQDENRKLQGTMKAMIMKHDLDIKSAIEKYHSIQREETKLLQAELREATDREKDQMRQYYEDKISVLCQDAERLQILLHETKELYLKVCEEKNTLETELQNKKDPNIAETLAKELTQIEQVYQEKHRQELEKAREAWDLEKQNDIEEAIRSNKESIAKDRILQSKETESNELRTEMGALELRLSEKEWEIQSLKAEEEKKIKSVQNYYTTLWIERQKEMQQIYHNKLDSIEQVQKTEFANAMAEMQKAIQDERAEIVKKHREILLKVKNEYDAQQNKMKLLENSQKQTEEKNLTVERRCEELTDKLNSIEQEKQEQTRRFEEHVHRVQEQTQEREQSWLEKLKLLNKEIKVLRKDKELLVKRTTEFENFAKTEASMVKGTTTASQTENHLVPKDEVVELQKLCLELLLQMKGELEDAFCNSSKRAAEHLKLAILEIQSKS